jgi:hypothetical protein
MAATSIFLHVQAFEDALGRAVVYFQKLVDQKIVVPGYGFRAVFVLRVVEFWPQDYFNKQLATNF